MLPVIVSYYTKDSLYEKQVKDLIASCERLQLPHDIAPIESLGSWSKNCCFKPSFLLQKLLQHRRPIVWTDADSMIMQTPTLFNNLQCDIAVHVREHLPENDIAKVLSGTIFLNYTSKTKRLLKLWIMECRRHVIDQEALRDVLYLYPHGASVVHLPSSYCHIFDKEADENAVFVHYQASRMERVLNEDNQVLRTLLEELDGEEFKTFRRAIDKEE